MSTGTLEPRSPFARALASVETLSVEDRAVLVDVVNQRLAAARRAEIVREVAAARRDYRRGKVQCRSAATLMAELGAK